VTDELQAQRIDSLNAELAPDLEVMRPLGTGRMADVYLARQASLDRLVAVKVLSKALAGDAVAKARFEREAKAAASLDHRNAISVYRFGYLSDGVPFLVMQYVSGGTLEDRVAAEGPLTVPEARQIMAEVADALAAAHQQGFVHRDVRPSNCLCDRDAGRVLLSDFGLAGILAQGKEADPKLTRVGEIIGTPGYLSPEQLKGESTTEQTDVYALGLLGYEILTGEGPFSTVSRRDLAVAHLREHPRSLSVLRTDVDPDLAKLLERCLAKEPEKRPTASFFAEAVRGKADVSGTGAAGAEGNVVESLLKRRLPQIVVATAVILYAIMSFIGMLVEQGNLPGWAFDLALNTFACGVAASAVVAWFHGEKGRQRVRTLEIGLLTVVGLIWIAVGAWIVAMV
jgi:serine/threonine-protein kinase